jgi:DNA polymerase-3 subunit delta'
MAGSIIIYSGSIKTQREKVIETVSKNFKKVSDWGDLGKHPDIKVLEVPNEKKSIGISDVREAIKYVNEKPFSARNKFLIVNNANTLTREAQNALLKTLEEPPSYTTIILLTKTLNDLLETVVSRCRKIQAVAEKKAPEKPNIKNPSYISDVSTENSFAKILCLDGGERLEWAGEFSKEEREDVVELLEKWLAEARELMLNSPSATELENVKLIYAVKKDLENTNAGVRLALEALVINLSGV